LPRTLGSAAAARALSPLNAQPPLVVSPIAPYVTTGAGGDAGTLFYVLTDHPDGASTITDRAVT